MHRIILLFAAALLVCVPSLPLSAQVSSQRPGASRASAATTPASAAQSPEEKAIRALANAYVKAYNMHDARAVGALFTADAQIVDQQGGAIQGRAAIEQVFADLFAAHPQASTSVTIKSIRFLNPSLAVEDGTAYVVLDEGAPAEPNDYTVLHIKQDGRWLMASARDLEGSGAPSSEHLKQLAWLIGEWIDESPEALVKTSYRWDDSRNFMLSDFTVQVAGKPVMNGTQRIGWDPLHQTLRSWTFDSEGGFAEGVYTRNANRWIIKMTGVTRDGLPATATNTITQLGRDQMSWQSRDRTVGGEPQPDISEMKVVRTPPKPM